MLIMDSITEQVSKQDDCSFTYLHVSSEGQLGLPLSVAKFDKEWAQFEEKTPVYTSCRVWSPYYIKLGEVHVHLVPPQFYM